MNSRKQACHSGAAAVVCSHVASGLPVLLAIRDEPVDGADSGWQFLCNSGRVELEAEAQVWSVSEVVAMDPGLSSLVDEPAGTRATRKDTQSAWIVQPT
jgi:hypothetical protein